MAAADTPARNDSTPDELQEIGAVSRSLANLRIFTRSKSRAGKVLPPLSGYVKISNVSRLMSSDPVFVLVEFVGWFSMLLRCRSAMVDWFPAVTLVTVISANLLGEQHSWFPYFPLGNQMMRMYGPSVNFQFYIKFEDTYMLYWPVESFLLKCCRIMLINKWKKKRFSIYQLVQEY